MKWNVFGKGAATCYRFCWLGNLLCVKSIVTIVLTVVFACLALSGKITGQDFLTVFSVVIAFYFGTQSQRLNEKLTETTGEKKQTDK